MNSSGIRPIGEQVLILPDEVPQATESGIQLMTDAELDRHELGQTEGTVIELGSLAAFTKDGNGFPVQSEFKPLDRVVFAKYSGLLMDGLDGRRYRLVDRKDIKGVFYVEAQNG